MPAACLCIHILDPPHRQMAGKLNSAPQEFSACLAAVAPRLVSSRPVPCLLWSGRGSVQYRLPAPASDPLRNPVP
jgi:hypothetical protein